MHTSRSQYTRSTFNSNGRGKLISLYLFIAPKVFTKIIKPVVRLLRQLGICLIIYLDNLLIMHHSKEELLQFFPLIRQLFKALGLQPGKVPNGSQTGNGIPRFSGKFYVHPYNWHS